jgi:hypothetical protein
MRVVGEPWVGRAPATTSTRAFGTSSAARRATLDCRSGGIFELPRGLPVL